MSGSTLQRPDAVLEAGASVATIAVGGRVYPLRRVASCRVCSSPQRLEIEEAVVATGGFAATARAFPESGVSTRNIRDHVAHGHLPLIAEGVRRIQGEVSERRAQLVEKGAEAVADYLTFAQAVLARVSERVLRGEIEPSVGDGLRAAQLLADAQSSADDLSAGDLATAIRIYLRTTKSLLSEDEFRELVDRLRENDTLRALLEALPK
jgi:hypothetical protein